ncbi:hypothetical protein A3E96_02830 [Candidatus Uhrbacteria bacterium RIFCSPHIGHO2_12_FULL_46_13]|uniref:DUF378 domain-containing protein n=1 Tax=Candidatus Uhrbacteria bacterium RIFCSPLOWO2_01_FULL_47_25 TaxID=1802402 RepID=A0A1F7UXX2_9BACT|nr:MAG: hypothetical protein A2752_02835 [Candidatus Uhrbacteria bacterium RIFCSPHIGHO2_01_FULL_46_23]OGL70582.1 MAG: hypothetical protein A3D60_03870 [Candidatus Uhrbacteria bacterium RIFCSPHIGHO2_02_FULL_47_29]OGL74883.1 MAG: hypothetical protein A3E96_02830 [Candidatus Uhrbacteria bacterium RIFCSPHIGHO2_12_FULL_46_13]OGL83115.1 MAG: hypothetical protein A2936_05375 [Candidatus Uhrbacteria bacterium RIFCSPLOWO2_01_FULL_47_25]OGL84481.1 MAG: hypothetical protein A3I37_03720 [Candidatus Uhrbact
MKMYHTIAFTLLVIGGLNWLLIGLFSWGIGNLVGDLISRIIYILVGLAAIYEVATHKQNCRQCGVNTSPSTGGGTMV